MNLIQKLAQFVHLTPDQIVTKLNKKWIRFGDLTDEDFERLADKQMVLMRYYPDEHRFRPDQPSYRGWNFWGHTDRSHFLTNLKNYWGILLEDYEDGDLPDLETARLAASEPG